MSMRISLSKILALVVLSLSLFFIPTIASAQDCTQSNLTPQQALQCGAKDAGGKGQTPANAEESINKTIRSIINLFSLAVGVIAVIMIMIGGFRYITSGGTAEKVSSAKTTILYAIIGLVIVALAQIIVKFVINETDTATSSVKCVKGEFDSGPNKGKECK